MSNNVDAVMKLQQYLKLKKKQLVSVGLPSQTYINLKKESHEKQKTIQHLIREKIESHSDDAITNEFVCKKIDKLIHDIRKQEILKRKSNGK